MAVAPETWAAVALVALEEIDDNLERKAAKGARLTMTQLDVDGLSLAMTALRRLTGTRPDDTKEGQSDV